MEQPQTRLQRRREQARDRFGVLLVLLFGSFVALGFADDTWARVLAGVLQLSALVFCFLVTSLRQNHRWLGLFALLGVVGIVLVSSYSPRYGQRVWGASDHERASCRLGCNHQRT